MIPNETSALNGAQRFPGWDWVSGMNDDDKAAQAVREALKRGYHLVDTGNERGVGEGGAVRGLFAASQAAAEMKSRDAAAKSMDETLEKWVWKR